MSTQNEIVVSEHNIEKGKISSWIYLAAACIYVFFQIDLIPDVPVLGWFDDAFIFLSAFTNFLQKQFLKTDTYLYRMCKILKYIFIVLAVITFLLFVITLLLLFKQ